MTHADRADLVVAMFNTSPDLVDLVRRALEPTGMVVVTALTYEIREGVVDVEAFLHQHDPDVILYDIAPPYDANWHLFQHIRRMDAMHDRRIVLTSVNRHQVESLVGKDETVYEIVGKPYDLDLLVRAVKEAARQRPVR